MDVCWLAIGLTGLMLVRPPIGRRPDGSSLWTDRGVPALENRLRDTIADWAARPRPEGLAVGIIADGGATTATLGESRLMPGGPPLGEALSEIGSITKSSPVSCWPAWPATASSRSRAAWRISSRPGSSRRQSRERSPSGIRPPTPSASPGCRRGSC